MEELSGLSVLVMLALNTLENRTAKLVPEVEMLVDELVEELAEEFLVVLEAEMLIEELAWELLAGVLVLIHAD